MAHGLVLIASLWVQGAIGIASAQEVDGDLGRKRSVLPSIRAANDCIAREVLHERGIAHAKGPDQLRAALVQPLRRCADELDAMVAAHDDAYSPGAGETFFQDTYLKTLPQVIRQRIAPALARRRAAEARPTAQKSQQDKDGLAALAALAASAPVVSSADEPIEEVTRHAVAEPDSGFVEAPWEPVQTAAFPPPLPVPSPAAAQTVEPTEASAPPPPQRIVETVSASRRHSPEDAGLGWLVVLGAAGLALHAMWRVIRDNRRRRPLKRKYGSSDIANRIMSGRMWPGMTVEMLRDSRGDPIHVRRQVHKTRTTEVWRYVQTGKSRFKNRITIENGIVIGFEQP